MDEELLRFVSLSLASFCIIQILLQLLSMLSFNSIVDFNFWAGRQILDQALIANEAIMEHRSKKKEGVVLKLDFEKAYDHVDWDFLDKVLMKKGFGYKWRTWK